MESVIQTIKNVIAPGINKQNYFYIISFPRSGNTWVVNSLKDYIGAQRAEILPSVYNGEIKRLSSKIKIKFAGKYNNKMPVGVKTHWSYDQFMVRKVPSAKIIYLLRDGRDVMISFYFYIYGFLGKDKEKAIHFSADEFLEFLKIRLPEYVTHVNSWQRHPDVLIIRYENLKNNFIKHLIRMKDFLGYVNIVAEGKVKNTYVDNFTKMDNHKNVLKGNNLDFYRKGIVGDWKNYYKREHVAVFKEIAGDTLINLGYEKTSDWNI